MRGLAHGAAAFPARLSRSVTGAGKAGFSAARWNDYEGTAAADDARPLLNTRSLYEVAGLDRHRGRIGHRLLRRAFRANRVVVYGVDRAAEKLPLEDADTLTVAAFHLGSSVRLGRFLAEAFGGVSVHLLSPVVNDTSLAVAEHARLAEARG